MSDESVREYSLLPSRIYWRGPDESFVVLDEDGVGVQVPRRLEQADLERLLEIIAVAKEARAVGLTFVPRPPTADEISRYDWHEKQRQAAKAIVKAIAPDPDSPAVPF